MRHDYANFGFAAADVIVVAGYELQEFDPVKINPERNAQIIQVHRSSAEVDEHYPGTIGIEGELSAGRRTYEPGLVRGRDGLRFLSNS